MMVVTTTARSIGGVAVLVAAVTMSITSGGGASWASSSSRFADAFAFQPCRPTTAAWRQHQTSAAAAAAVGGARRARNKVRLAAEAEGQEESIPAPSKIDSIIRDLHDSSLQFRIVVIGNGAILESTATLGPHMAESTSPKTGERLVTLASDDRSFEFHLKPDAIARVIFAEVDKPDSGKTLRIVRMLREDDGPICSLILADGGDDEAVSWYKAMTIRYGYEVRSGDA